MEGEKISEIIEISLPYIESRHPELDSGSLEMLNQVQHDDKVKITAPETKEYQDLIETGY